MDYWGWGGAKGMLAPISHYWGAWPPCPPPSSYAYVLSFHIEKYRNFILFQVANRARMHGIGRHSSEEIHKIGCDDIQAISTYLGSKPYLMGDRPTVVSYVTSQWACSVETTTRRRCCNVMRLLDLLKLYGYISMVFCQFYKGKQLL